MNVRVIIFPFIHHLFPFCFASNAVNFFIHSLEIFVLKKSCLHIAGFRQLDALIFTFICKYILKMSEKKRLRRHLFDFYVESIAFRIKILTDITSINN